MLDKERRLGKIVPMAGLLGMMVVNHTCVKALSTSVYSNLGQHNVNSLQNYYIAARTDS